VSQIPQEIGVAHSPQESVFYLFQSKCELWVIRRLFSLEMRFSNSFADTHFQDKALDDIKETGKWCAL
jgi:hypothetical protein